MHRCDKCGQVFIDEECPYCGSEDFTDVFECEICGCIFESKYEKYGACPQCVDLIVRQFEAYRGRISDAEQKILDEYLEERYGPDGIL